MSELISAAKQQILLWWLVGFWAVFFSFSALSTSIVTALYGVQWNGLSGQEKFVITLLVFSNWATTIMALFNKAISRVKSGELPISEGDTQLLIRKLEENK